MTSSYRVRQESFRRWYTLLMMAPLLVHVSGLAPRPIRRVAIVGSGIAGLSVAHALVAADPGIELCLFESRSKLDPQIGGGVQINGGLYALQQIDANLAKAVQQAGVTLAGIQTKVAPNWDTILRLPLPEIVKDNPAAAATLLNHENDFRPDSASPSHKNPSDSTSDNLLWTCILRGTLQQILVEKLPPTVRSKVQCNKPLTNLVAGTEEGTVLCQFGDGSEAGPFDLVVGCDGVNSKCKQYVSSGRILDSQKQNSLSFYAGLRIRYAVQTKVDKNKNAQEPTFLTQYLDNGVYGLLGSYGAGAKRPPVYCAVSVSLDPDYLGPFRVKSQQETSATPTDENVEWQPSKTSTSDMVPVPVAPTMDAADRSFELGVFFHNPFSFWSRPVKDSTAMVVLCGDAAHAVPPFLGQGANQAIQDAYCLVQKIDQYNKDVEAGENSSLPDLLFDYQRTRWPATFSIFWKSLFLGYLETGGPNGLYSNLRNIFFKATGFLGVAQRVLLGAAIPKLE